MSEHNQKIALVTGGNRGIGLETVRQLAQQGIKVLLGARNEEKGAAAAAALRDEDLNVEFIHLDVDDAGTHETAAEYIEGAFGRLDILVNNAGIYLDETENGAPVPASRTSLDVFRKTFETNFFNIIAPRDNEKDLADIPKNVLDVMNVHLVDTMDEVLKIALDGPLPGPTIQPADGDAIGDGPEDRMTH